MDQAPESLDHASESKDKVSETTDTQSENWELAKEVHSKKGPAINGVEGSKQQEEQLQQA